MSIIVGYPKVLTYTKFEHFVIICFRVMLRTNKQKKNIKTDRQTNKQSNDPKHTIHAD